MTWHQLILRPHLRPRPYLSQYAQVHAYAYVSVYCSHPSLAFTVIIYGCFALITCLKLSLHHRLHLRPRLCLRQLPLLTPISPVHSYHIHMLLCTDDLSPVISTPSLTPTPTPIRRRPRLRPLFTSITSFHSYHTYCYFALVTCLQSFLGPGLHLLPCRYARVYAHCSHPHPFIHLFQLSDFYFPLMTCLQLFFRPRLHLCPRAYGHASTPTSTPIAQKHPFLS